MGGRGLGELSLPDGLAAEKVLKYQGLPFLVSPAPRQLPVQRWHTGLEQQRPQALWAQSAGSWKGSRGWPGLGTASSRLSREVEGGS